MLQKKSRAGEGSKSYCCRALHRREYSADASDSCRFASRHFGRIGASVLCRAHLL